MEKIRLYIIFSAVIGILASLIDLITMFSFGIYFPKYNQLHDTVSMLGVTVSPISVQMSTLWIIVGVLLIVFGIGFRFAFADNGKYATISSWMIILYGFGEGIGSGIFKADRIADTLTRAAVIHEILGAMGVISILLLPLFMQKVIKKSESPNFFKLSRIVLFSGMIFLILFLFRFTGDHIGFISLYKGLWQRIFILISYIYLITIAVLIIKGQKMPIQKATNQKEI